MQLHCRKDSQPQYPDVHSGPFINVKEWNVIQSYPKTNKNDLSMKTFLLIRMQDCAPIFSRLQKFWKNEKKYFLKKIIEIYPFIPETFPIILQQCCREPIRVAWPSPPSLRRTFETNSDKDPSEKGWEEVEAQLGFPQIGFRQLIILGLELLLISNLCLHLE